MATASTLGQEFTRPGMLDHHTIEVDVGGIIGKVVFIVGVGLVGAVALSEAKDIVVDGLTKVFGKYQNKVTTVLPLSDI